MVKEKIRRASGVGRLMFISLYVCTLKVCATDAEVNPFQPMSADLPTPMRRNTTFLLYPSLRVSHLVHHWPGRQNLDINRLILQAWHAGLLFLYFL